MLNKLEGSYFNIIKAMYEKPMVKTTFNGERMKSFPLRSETGKGTFATVIQLVLEVLNKAIRQEKGIGNGKEEVKLSLFADVWYYMLKSLRIPQKNPKLPKQLLELINELNKVAG